MVDAGGLNPPGRKAMRVRVPPRVRTATIRMGFEIAALLGRLLQGSWQRSFVI